MGKTDLSALLLNILIGKIGRQLFQSKDQEMDEEQSVRRREPRANFQHVHS